ncbi:MAG: NAD(P)/FAD-dependent oxidoreductase [Chitinophagaceae bacterium]|nr:NAD(P)/FAD-dependent oxidoreductase [Chitinophagaceae bacterium]
MNQKKLLVIGGGAAGFFCAVNAARLNPALQVTIAEKSGQVLQKVKVSGGGRCNVTHACFDIQEMAGCYPRGERFMRSAFHHFFSTDTIEWFQSRSVPLKTEDDGRMFPEANTSQAIIDCLFGEMQRYNVTLQLHFPVEKIEPLDEGFHIYYRKGEKLYTDFVMIACGGFSKATQFDWLKNLKLQIEEPVPSLFTFNFPGHPLNKLMGIAASDAIIKIAGSKRSSNGPVLITHWGLSGPAVLKLSAFAARELSNVNYQFKVVVNWCSTYQEQSFVEKIKEQRALSPARKLINGNFTGLASRLWEFLLIESGIDETKRWADLTVTMINKLAKNCCAYEMNANGKTTFKEEFVSAGGISLKEMDVNSMMSKRYNGLYFAGEILDVDGITGGYNFQHAWTSAFIAATHIADRA